MINNIIETYSQNSINFKKVRAARIVAIDRIPHLRQD